MDAQLHRQPLDFQCVFVGILSRFKRMEIGFDGFRKLAVLVSRAAFLEGWSEVRLQDGVGAPLGNHGLAHVADGVEIKVRRGADEAVGPVVGAKRGLLARRVFETAVRAEVHDGIGLETVTRPKVGSDVGVRRGGIGAVHNLEIVVAQTSHGLRHQHDVAELQSRHGEATVGRGHIRAGKIAIQSLHLVVAFRTQRLLHPTFILLAFNQFRISILHKTLKRALGVSAQHRALPLYQLTQFICRIGQILNTIAFRFQALQQIEKRRNHLHARGGQSVLARTFVIVNGHFFLSIRLGFQRDMSVYRLNEISQSVGFGIDFLQAFRIDAVRENGVWPNGAVDFGRDDALRQETAAHAHLVSLPFLCELWHIYGRKQRNVSTFQILYHIVAHAPVRHVDDG